MSIPEYDLLAKSDLTAKAKAFTLMTESEEKHNGYVLLEVRVPKSQSELCTESHADRAIGIPHHWVNITVPYGSLLWSAITEALADSIDETLETLREELTKDSDS